MDSNAPPTYTDPTGPPANRFVILRHTVDAAADPASSGTSLPQRGDHFDLMLERGETLWTWALPSLPVAGQSQWAERLPDHRLAYLTYEGSISIDRGSVERVINGWYKVLEETETLLAIQLHADRNTWHLRITLGENDEVRIGCE